MAESQEVKLPSKRDNLQAKAPVHLGATRVKSAIPPSVKSEESEVPKAVAGLGLESLPVSPFPFMKLPSEIRVMIYKEALVAPSEVAVHYRPWWILHTTIEDHAGDEEFHSPALICRIFRVSKTIYAEAMPVYFGCNTFAFVSLDILSVLNKLKPDFRRSIRSLSINFWGLTPAKSVKLLQGCISLRKLLLRVGYRTIRCWKNEFLPLLKAHGVNDLLKLRGIEELKVENASHYAMEEFIKGWEPFVGALQVLKQPRNAVTLRRQDKKDYPPEKAKRTVFGKTNVTTRSERVLTEERSKATYELCHV
ncbi:MAG: hypothetical protein Q9173_004132 [Seirophora scorigena]